MKKYICDMCQREIPHMYPPPNFGRYDFSVLNNNQEYMIVPEITIMNNGFWEAADLCVDCARYLVGKV